MKIGIMGGTFDPIHIGHLILGEQAYEQFGLDHIVYLPSGNPPHKRNRTGGATNAQRLQMVRLACAGNPHFSVSDREMRESGFSYTYRTRRIRRSGFTLFSARILCLTLNGGGIRTGSARPVRWWPQRETTRMTTRWRPRWSISGNVFTRRWKDWIRRRSIYPPGWSGTAARKTGRSATMCRIR